MCTSCTCRSAAAASPSAGVVLVDVLADDVSSGANLYLDGDDEHRPSSGTEGLLLLLLLENIFRLFLFVEPPPPPPAALTTENDVGVRRLLLVPMEPFHEGRGTTCEASVLSAIVRSGGGGG